MAVQKVALEELSEPVRAFLARASAGQGILVEDEAGRVRYGVVQYIEASPEEQRAAWDRLQRLQGKTRQAIEGQGRTVDEVERLILADDD